MCVFSDSAYFNATCRLHTSHECRAVQKNTTKWNYRQLVHLVLGLQFINRKCPTCEVVPTCVGKGCLRSSAGSGHFFPYFSYESVSRKLTFCLWAASALPLRRQPLTAWWAEDRIGKSKCMWNVLVCAQGALSHRLAAKLSSLAPHTHSAPSICFLWQPIHSYCSQQKSFQVPSYFIMWSIEDVAAVPFPFMPVGALTNRNQIRAERVYNALLWWFHGIFRLYCPLLKWLCNKNICHKQRYCLQLLCLLFSSFWLHYL